MIQGNINYCCLKRAYYSFVEELDNLGIGARSRQSEKSIYKAVHTDLKIGVKELR